MATTPFLTGTFDQRKQALIDYFKANQGNTIYNNLNPGQNGVSENFYMPLDLSLPWADAAINDAINKSISSDKDQNAISRAQQFDYEKNYALTHNAPGSAIYNYWANRPIEAQWAKTFDYTKNPSSTWNKPPSDPGGSFLTTLRDLGETAAVIAGNFVVPGSSALTSNLASKNSQKQLSSDIGQIAQVGSSIAGGLSGNTNPISKIVDNTVGYNPTYADSIWSESANPLTQAGANITSGAIQGAVKGGVNSAANGGNVINGSMSGAITGGIGGGVNSVVPSTGNGFVDSLVKGGTTSYLSNLFNNSNSSGSNNSSGGSMADNSATINIGGANIPLSSLFQANNTLGSMIAPALGAYSAGKQQDFLNNAFNNAQHLISTPTADQRKYRDLLNGLTANPSSIFDSPIYKAVFDQGQQALERSQSARGLLGSGNAAYELQKYGMGQGLNFYNDLVNQYAPLSGITQDTGVRATGADAMMNGAALASNLMGKQYGDLGTLGSNAANYLTTPDANGATGLTKLKALLGGGSNSINSTFGSGLNPSANIGYLGEGFGNDMVNGLNNYYSTGNTNWFDGITGSALDGYRPDVANQIWDSSLPDFNWAGGDYNWFGG